MECFRHRWFHAHPRPLEMIVHDGLLRRQVWFAGRLEGKTGQSSTSFTYKLRDEMNSASSSRSFSPPIVLHSPPFLAFAINFKADQS